MKPQTHNLYPDIAASAPPAEPVPPPRRASHRLSHPAVLLPILLTLAGTLTGCLSVRTRTVGKTVIAPHVLDATLDQLVTQMDVRYKAIQTLSASVDVAATTGGEHEGQVKEIPTFAGYIFLRKPSDLRVLLLLPVIRSRALDMVSDGATFKLLVPPKSRAITGSDVRMDPPFEEPGTAVPQASSLDSLRPNIIRDALLVPPLAEGEFITLTQHAHILVAPTGHKEGVEEPDYDVTVLRERNGRQLERVRVIHIGRTNLLPYGQDIYDHHGRIVTQIAYSRYAKSGDTDFPMNILISRPIDEYTLNIAITKLQVNPKLDDEQFILKFPDNIPVQKMN